MHVVVAFWIKASKGKARRALTQIRIGWCTCMCWSSIVKQSRLLYALCVTSRCMGGLATYSVCLKPKATTSNPKSCLRLTQPVQFWRLQRASARSAWGLGLSVGFGVLGFLQEGLSIYKVGVGRACVARITGYKYWVWVLCFSPVCSEGLHAFTVCGLGLFVVGVGL